MMMKNLHVQSFFPDNQERGCDLLSLEKYKDIEDIKERYRDFGYTNVFCEDMATMYMHFIPKEEIKRQFWLVSLECRVSRIELFDEYEEWNLIQSHYCILAASQGTANSCFSNVIQMATYCVSLQTVYN